jgi:hypothetical protein
MNLFIGKEFTYLIDIVVNSETISSAKDWINTSSTFRKRRVAKMINGVFVRVLIDR